MSEALFAMFWLAYALETLQVLIQILKLLSLGGFNSDFQAQILEMGLFGGFD